MQADWERSVSTVTPARADSPRRDPRTAQPIHVVADNRANEVGKVWAITDIRVPQFGDIVEPKDLVIGTVVGREYRQALCPVDGMHMLVDEFLAATLSGGASPSGWHRVHWGKHSKVWWRHSDPAKLRHCFKD